MILCAANKQILFATTTFEGSAHDKAIADDAALDFSSRVVILADSGFQGFSAGNATVLLPCKKPRGKDHSTEHHRRWNRLFARVRVKVEHALANVKTFRIVKETMRLKTAECRDIVFEIACGLANLRLQYPNRKL